jgi:ankyrin repeat protein
MRSARRNAITGIAVLFILGTVMCGNAIIHAVGYPNLKAQGLIASVSVVAAQGGHWDLVHSLIRIGVNPNASDRDGQTLLSWAATTGDLSDVRELVRKGASIDQADSLGRQPLVWAAYKGDERLIEALLSAGANVNPRSTFTPLGAAIENGHQPVVRQLLRHGADPNAWHRGWTPLMACAVFGRGDIARILTAAGARIEIRNRLGKTAVMLATDPATARTLRELDPRGAVEVQQR